MFAIAKYTARDSEFYARSVVSKLLATARSIPDNPLIGRIVPEIAKEQVREYFAITIVHEHHHKVAITDRPS